MIRGLISFKKQVRFSIWVEYYGSSVTRKTRSLCFLLLCKTMNIKLIYTYLFFSKTIVWLGRGVVDWKEPLKNWVFSVGVGYQTSVYGFLLSDIIIQWEEGGFHCLSRIVDQGIGGDVQECWWKCEKPYPAESNADGERKRRKRDGVGYNVLAEISALFALRPTGDGHVDSIINTREYSSVARGRAGALNMNGKLPSGGGGRHRLHAKCAAVEKNHRGNARRHE